VLELQGRLARKLVSEILVNLLFRVRDLLYSKSAEEARSLRSFADRRFLRAEIHVLVSFQPAKGIPRHTRRCNDLLVEERPHDIRQFTIEVDLNALLVLVGKDVTVIERILEIEAVPANARDVVRSPRAETERIQFE